MRYTKPQITNTLNATHAVQSVGLPASEKQQGITPDGAEPRCSPLAYEADE
jgi:hypothetical protein